MGGGEINEYDPDTQKIKKNADLIGQQNAGFNTITHNANMHAYA